MFERNSAFNNQFKPSSIKAREVSDPQIKKEAVDTSRLLTLVLDAQAALSRGNTRNLKGLLADLEDEVRSL